MNQLFQIFFQSPHPEVGMVSLLYDNAPERNGRYLYKISSRIIHVCRRVVDMLRFFYQYGDMKKDLDDSPSMFR